MEPEEQPQQNSCEKKKFPQHRANPKHCFHCRSSGSTLRETVLGQTGKTLVLCTQHRQSNTVLFWCRCIENCWNWETITTVYHVSSTWMHLFQGFNLCDTHLCSKKVFNRSTQWKSRHRIPLVSVSPCGQFVVGWGLNCMLVQEKPHSERASPLWLQPADLRDLRQFWEKTGVSRDALCDNCWGILNERQWTNLASPRSWGSIVSLKTDCSKTAESWSCALSLSLFVGPKILFQTDQCWFGKFVLICLQARVWVRAIESCPVDTSVPTAGSGQAEPLFRPGWQFFLHEPMATVRSTLAFHFTAPCPNTGEH